MPVIINEFEVEVLDDEGAGTEQSPAAKPQPAADPSPLVARDLDDWRRSREERLSDD